MYKHPKTDGEVAMKRGAKIAVLLMLLAPQAAKAADAPINKADTVWMLLSSALVLFMVPGLALFYGGMVRKKNTLNTLMMSLICMGLITLEWVVLGFSASFGTGLGGFLGGLNHIFLKGVGLEPLKDYAGTIPGYAFVLFQMMFAIIAPALISGAVVERMKFSAYVLFILLWAIFVYNPVCHWVWAKEGWLMKLGALDFAGGTVIHINAGISALVAALILGKRKGFLRENFLPHNIPLTVIGTALLWFGWFGFNAGSALEAGKLSVLAFMNTQVAAATAAFAWVLAEQVRFGKMSTIGFCSGAVAGLVAITPAAGFVNTAGAIAIGAIAGVVCSWAVELKVKLRMDDSLDVFGVHGIGGLIGAVATGIFACVGEKGLIYGNFALVGKQILASLITVVYSAVLTLVILKVVDILVGLRVDSETEVAGLDIMVHGEEAYK